MPDFPKKITDQYNGQKYEAPYKLNSTQQEAYNKYMFAKEQYLSLVTFLNTLNVKDEKTGEIIGYGKNEFGFQKNMDEETLDVLREKCHMLNQTGQSLIKLVSEKKTTPESDSLLYDIHYNTKMAMQDANAIENIDTANIPSYAKMKRDASYTVIDTGTDTLDHVGGKKSSRIPIRYVNSNGDLKNGFFTKDNAVDYNNKTQWNYIGIEVKDGENINSRNTSMSDMASLLNMEKSLAKSTEMTIIENGKEYHGTFMANANGYDIDEIEKDEYLIEGRELEIDYNSVVKSGTDMMVLDYICLNVDRHQSNCFYDIERTKDGTFVLKGLQGLDNDMCFGNKIPKDESIQNMASISNLKCMHKDTADRIRKLSKESITATLLATGRTEEEINACWERTKYIQELLKNKKIQVKTSFDEKDFNSLIPKTNKHGVTPLYNALLLKDEYDDKKNSVQMAYSQEMAQFVNKELLRLQVHHPDAFKNPKLQTQVIDKLKELHLKNKKQELVNKDLQAKIKKGIEGLHNKVRIDSKLAIKQQSKDFDKLFNKLWKPKEKDIPEYAEMYDSMKSLHELLGEFKGKDLALLSDMDRNRMAIGFKNVEDKIKAYVPAISKDPSRNDLKRIAISHSIQDVCIKAQDQREQAVNELNETMASAYKSVGAAHNQLEKSKAKGLGSVEYTMAKAEFDAKTTLAGFLGSLEKPNEIEKEKINTALASLTIIEKINRMKTEEPARYDEQMQALREDPDALNRMTNDLLSSKGFSKLASGVDFRYALSDNVQKALAIQCDKGRLFNNIIAKESTLTQKVDKEFEILKNASNPTI